MSNTASNDTERDAGLTALYRASDQDGPSAALDKAIQAAARRAVLSRPRLAGLPFSRSWRVSMSIAAVLVLCVSLVALMREEAPKVADLPPAYAPTINAEPGSAGPVAAGRTGADVQSAPAPASKTPSSDGPDPLRQKVPAWTESGTVASAPAVAGRDSHAAEKFADETPAGASVARKPSTDALEAESASSKSAPGLAAKRAQAQAFPGAAHDNSNAARQSERSDMRASPANSAAGPSAMASQQAAPPTAGTLESNAELSPEKWIERIEALRKQGRFAEAKASLADFRKRYPDYALPSSLNSWIQP